MRKNIVILGAGPAALTAGLELSQKGHNVTLIEREFQVGGISKTVQSNGFRFDVGGHRFFTKNETVNNLWKKTLGKDFKRTPRLSRIFYNNKFFKYPIEIGDTLKNAGVLTSILCMVDFIRYRIIPIKPEKSFADWVTNRFGKRLFDMFFKSYTEKVWGISTKELSAEWATQRIKGLSLSGAVKNAMFKPKEKAKSLIEEFMYPKFGPGMMYEKMADNIKKSGGKIFLGQSISSIRTRGNKVVEVLTEDNKSYKGDFFISTIPLPSTIKFLTPKIKSLQGIDQDLKFRDFLSVNLVLRKRDVFPDTWIYVHDPSVIMGRIQNFKNWSEYMTPDKDLTPIGCEYFCNQGDDLWNKSDLELIQLATEEIVRIGFADADQVIDGNVYRMRDAYPVYMGNYKEAVERAKEVIDRFSNLSVAGRGGMFRYNNMDHSILAGLYAARNIMGEDNDLWSVNTEEEYHEQKKT